jgi:OmcA/MtrC family decaheme c-type cytochrome
MTATSTVREVAAAALALGLLALAGCQQPPAVGPKASFTRKPPGPQVTLVGATVNALRRVEVTFRVTVDDEAVDVSVARALRPAFTLASLGTDPVTGAPAWESHVLTGEETLPSLPLGGPGTPALADARQPGFEEDGIWSLSGTSIGQFRYAFVAQLPPGYEDRTHRVGVFLQAAEKGSALTSATLDFAPTGDVAVHELVTDARCADCHDGVRAHGGTRTGAKLCVTCHTWQLADGGTVDPAAVAGATPATDPNPLELGRLVHRIHRGKNLPTLYRASSAAAAPVPPLPLAAPPPLPFLPGRNAAEPGRKFSVVGDHGHERVFGQIVSRTEYGPTARTAAFGVTFPRDYRDCDACHAGAAGEAAVDAHVSRKSCQGCHPDVWFGDGAPGDAYHLAHPGGPQANDAACAGCHVTGAPKLYAPIGEAHVAIVKSPRFSKPQLRILSIEGCRPGERPTVVFTVADRNGPITPLRTTELEPAGPSASPVARGLSSLALVLAGPAEPDFVTRADGATLLAPLREVLVPTPPAGAVLVDEGAGQYRYTFAGTVPAGASGKWLVVAEGRRASAAAPTRPYYDVAGDAFVWPYTGEAITEAAENALAWADLGTGALHVGPSPRRTIVAQEKCNRCHLRLTFHGGQRIDVLYCAACHTPERTDWEMRPKDASHVVELWRTYDNIEERSVHLKVLIHRLHTGGRSGMAELSALDPFVMYGYGQNPKFRDRGEYPNDLTDCRICHVGRTYNIDAIPAGAAPTVANETASVRHHHTETHEAGEQTTYPIAAACRGCHANGHAVVHTTRYGAASGKEQCGSCHGPKGTYAVEKVHGLPLTE